MIGLDFPVKPEWIYAVHQLWQPEQPVGDLVQAALDQAMPELGGEKTRRNSLTVILRYFVTTEGGGQSRRTSTEDVWVIYGRTYGASTLAPAYLAHLVGQNEVAQSISRFLVRRYAPGDVFASGELRRHVAATFGQRKVVTNAASAFLRTLDSFGVLTSGQQQGEYQYVAQLPVAREMFPLIVWAWWLTHRTPQIDLDKFPDDPIAAFLRVENFAAYWRAYQPTLWSLDERLEGRRATFKHSKEEFFRQALLGLLPTKL